MTLTTVSVRVSKRRTSPESEPGPACVERVCGFVESGDAGDGTGDG